MTEYEKRLILQVSEELPDAMMAAWRIHAHFVRGVHMLEWCKRHGLTGYRLAEFDREMRFSKTRIGRFLLSKIYGEPRFVYASDLR